MREDAIDLKYAREVADYIGSDHTEVIMTREEVLERVILERQPSREFATVEQLGGTAVFLCSSAADQITGTTISVDGGWTAL